LFIRRGGILSKQINVCLAWHNLNSSNYGVGALAIAHIGMLIEAARLAGVELRLETLGTPNVAGLGVKEEVERRFGIRISHVDFSLKQLVRDALRFRYPLLRVFAKYDLMLDIGEGDSFTDIYGSKRFYVQFSTKLLGILTGTRLVFAPQTIGPFSGTQVRLLATWIMKRAQAVYVRDQKSCQFALELGIQPIEVSDVAFSLPFTAMQRRPGAVGVNVSGLMWNSGYSGNNEFALKVDYKDFILNTVRGLRQRGKEVHLIGHVITDDILVEDDYRACQAVKQQFAQDIRVLLAPRFASPIEAKSYISQLEFFTGARMHATIGAISAGVPTVPIAYSRKFSGVFGSLGYPYTLDAYNLDAATLLQCLFDYHDHHRADMEKTLAAALEKACQYNRDYVAYLQGLLSHA
jgi:polysaccharide pyruvyl transferase WcaK-like protein